MPTFYTTNEMSDGFGLKDIVFFGITHTTKDIGLACERTEIQLFTENNQVIEIENFDLDGT